MKVLFISNYREFSGWGNAAYNKILSMYSAGIDLYLRPLYFSGKNRECELLDELESKSSKKYDYILQYTLPNMYSYQGPAINIGNYECETTFKSSMWQKYINMMDFGWVSSQSSQDQSYMSGVSIPTAVIPNSIDLDYYRNHDMESHIDEIEEGSYNFYFVGELSKRKNISTLIRAFYCTFDPKENVNLVLKLNKPGYSPTDVYNEFEKLKNKTINGLKMGNNYKKIICLTDFLHRDNLTAIVKKMNCFVTTSYGEGWCIPAIEAVALGHQLVYPESSSIKDFAPEDSSYSISTTLSNCYDTVDTLRDLYTAKDYWQEPLFSSICRSMRMAYIDRNNVNKQKISQSAERFSIENVGKIIKESLENATEYKK